MADAGDTVAKRIVYVAADCGISLVATLPDGWITRLISCFAGDRPENALEASLGLHGGTSTLVRADNGSPVQSRRVFA